MTTVNDVPLIVPVLSPGRHRRPRQGACFMEFASYLAGEKWSDHPSCTHPLLAFLARGVNDFTRDAARQRLATMIPSVIGLTSSDPRTDVLIALRAASTALPVVSESRQRALASGIMACDRRLAASAGGHTAGSRALVAAAERDAPLAWSWAREFAQGLGTRHTVSFTRQGRAIVSTAVLGVAQACIVDPDLVLHRMLRDAIDDTAMMAATAAPPSQAAPEAALDPLQSLASSAARSVEALPSK